MLPEGRDRPPVIVMAHGFANVRTARLPEFAERFVEVGYAVFLFDYRTFGDSEGEVRFLVNPWRQIEDWEAAIDYVRRRPDVDPERVVLWGTSYSGGHVLHIAARDHDLAAVISQIPHVSGVATALKAHPATTIKCSVAAVLDVILGLFGRTFYSRIVGEPGERAGITRNGAVEAYRMLIPPEIPWQNKVLSRSFLYVPFYSPRDAVHRICAPTLIVGARGDLVVPASAAKRAARKIPRGSFALIEGDHFAPYFGECFEENIALQLEFLREHVPAAELDPGTPF